MSKEKHARSKEMKKGRKRRKRLRKSEKDKLKTEDNLLDQLLGMGDKKKKKKKSGERFDYLMEGKYFQQTDF